MPFTPRYIYEQEDWPQFRWNHETLAAPLDNVHRQQERLLGRLESLGFKLRQEAALKTLTEDVVKSSEIEGEKLDAEQVRSSIARRLGMDIGGLKPVDRNVEGIVEMMLDATRHFDQPLTAARLFAWHSSLFPTGRSGMKPIRAGAWRDDSGGPMQVVSGPVGREHVHFEAPPAGKIDLEIRAFLDWFNGDTESDWVVKAGLAHLWFVTIHPFDDGNGRIARAVSDMSLARSEKSPLRFYSVSGQIRHEGAAYYDTLEQTQRGTTDVTPWLVWFVGCVTRALAGTQTSLASIFGKAAFWGSFSGEMNERQRLMVNHLLDGFEGKLTAEKWAKITKCSHNTAVRDISDLIKKGVLVQNPEGGRSTSYRMVEAKSDQEIS